jgi:hypothetical protein
MHEKSLKYFVFIEKMPIFVMIVEEGLVVGSTAPWSFPEAVLPGNDIVDACEAVRRARIEGYGGRVCSERLTLTKKGQVDLVFFLSWRRIPWNAFISVYHSSFLFSSG